METLDFEEYCDNCCDPIHTGDCDPISHTRFLISEGLAQADTKTVLLAIATWKEDNGLLIDAIKIKQFATGHFK